MTCVTCGVVHYKIQMAQRRRSSRCSRGEQYESRVRTIQSLIAYNPLIIQEEAERIFKEVMQRALNDFAKTMREHDLAPEMAEYRIEDHLAVACEEMEKELDVLGGYIEEKVIRADFIAKAKLDLDAMKKKRKEKARAVLETALRLSESIRDSRVDELVRVLQGQMERHRLQEIKNTYQYDKTRSLREKYQKQYDDHLQRVEERYQRVCGPLDQKYAM